MHAISMSATLQYVAGCCCVLQFIAMCHDVSILTYATCDSRVCVKENEKLGIGGKLKIY